MARGVGKHMSVREERDRKLTMMVALMVRKHIYSFETATQFKLNLPNLVIFTILKQVNNLFYNFTVSDFLPNLGIFSFFSPRSNWLGQVM